ncbi:hypothetical protein E2C01_023341 [Portunus trituberculatus]|uniref:Uncharacterized protein n=1 Tax=Portunus trituberculatus TaxID=210409 RepID=A0A5B7EA52_PORTR|nr:hypothetical protein [Portunus trituberculatus]
MTHKLTTQPNTTTANPNHFQPVLILTKTYPHPHQPNPHSPHHTTPTSAAPHGLTSLGTSWESGGFGMGKPNLT